MYRLPAANRQPVLRSFSHRRRIPIAFCVRRAYNNSYFFFYRTAMCKSIIASKEARHAFI